MVVSGVSRLWALFLALFCVFLLSSIYLYRRPTALPSSTPLTTAPSDEPLRERQTAFWQAFQPILERHAPGCPSPERDGKSGAIGFDAVKAPPRPDLIIMPEADVSRMRQSHEEFLNDIRSAKTLPSVHAPGTRGLVSTAGGPYFPVFVSALRMLRRTGSKLPVELFLKDPSEYESDLCESILPGLNARCIMLSDILSNQTGSSVEIAHYQLKIFAILFSSFEEVIWMDADCFPLHRPEELFDSEPFRSTGMVTWPDFWASTASPVYYNISEQPVPPMTLRASSETGVILISKKTHFLTLLLAAYYNYYGPSHYFMLLSQGAPGEGDKETFLAAASAVGEPFYAVSEPVKPIGHPKKDGKISGSAMVQSDPVEDYLLTSQGKWRVKDPSVAKAPRVFFVHAHYPKFNPGEPSLWGHNWETAPTVKPDGSDGRAWIVATETLKRFGYDVEKAYWEEIKWVSCNLEKQFKSWKDKSGICDRVQSYWKNVFESPDQDVPKFTDD
ncbi:putative alpha-1,2-mannosyltransferase [Thermoascus aurantiacus ATCC 26904]